jgi:hypothetical protein
LAGRPWRVHDDVVDHAPDPLQAPHGALRVVPVRQRVDGPVERHPSVGNGRADLRVRNEHVPFERVSDGAREVRVGAGEDAREPDFDVVGDVEHSRHAVRGFPCREFLCEAVHRTRQGDDALANGDADFGLGDSTFPSKLAKDVLLNLRIGLGNGDRGHNALLSIVQSAPTAVSANPPNASKRRSP